MTAAEEKHLAYTEQTLEGKNWLPLSSLVEVITGPEQPKIMM